MGFWEEEFTLWLVPWLNRKVSAGKRQLRNKKELNERKYKQFINKLK